MNKKQLVESCNNCFYHRSLKCCYDPPTISGFPGTTEASWCGQWRGKNISVEVSAAEKRIREGSYDR